MRNPAFIALAVVVLFAAAIGALVGWLVPPLLDARPHSEAVHSLNRLHTRELERERNRHADEVRMMHDEATRLRRIMVRVCDRVPAACDLMREELLRAERD